MYPPDDLDAPGRLPTQPTKVAPFPTPIAPQHVDTAEEIKRDILAAAGPTAAELDIMTAQIEADLRGAQTDVNQAISAKIGEGDLALRTAIIPVNGAIDKATDSALRELIHSEEELRLEGIDIPRNPDDLHLAMNDPTGELVIRQLQPPESPPAPMADLPYSTDFRPPPPPVYIGTPVSDYRVPPVEPPPPPPPPEPFQQRPPEPPPTSPPPPEPIIPLPPPPLTGPTCPPGTFIQWRAFPPGVTPTPGYVGTQYAPSVGTEYGYCTPSPTETPPPPVDTHCECPAPPPPPIGTRPPVVVPSAQPTLDYTDVCKALDTWKRIYSAGPFTTVPNPGQDGLVGIGDLYRSGVALVNGLAGVIFGNSPDTVNLVTKAAYAQTGDILGGVSQFLSAFAFLPSVTMGFPTETINLGLMIGSANKAGAAIGFDMTAIVAPLQYVANSLNANLLLSQSEADRAYVRGAITQDTWRCLTKAQGNSLTYREPLMMREFAWPNVNESVMLWNRRAIDRRTYERYMEWQGAPDEENRANFEALAVAIPGPADLVRYMVRDAADDAVALKYQYDKEFELKLYGAGGKENPGPMAAWMRSQGVTEDYMRFDWRSHWQMPSNTALYEMLHRLRGNRKAVRDWQAQRDSADDGAAFERANPKPSVVTVEDVRSAIEVNDMAPGWVQQIIDVSYHPINRTDAIDAFFNGTIDKARLRELFLDNGYNDADAQFMADIQENKRAMRVANQSGVWTARGILAAYMAGTIDGMRADQLLEPLILDAKVRNDVITGADAQVDAKSIAEELRRIRRAFFTGLIDANGARNQMGIAQVALGRRAQLLAQWTSQRDGRYREVGAGKIVTWTGIGIISEQDAFDRIVRLGYSQDDARRMVAQGIRAKQRAAVSEAKATRSETERIVKNQKQAAREARTTLENRLSDIQKARKVQSQEEALIVAELADRDGAVMPVDALAALAHAGQPKPSENGDGAE